MANGKRLTLEDVARTAGVSPATASLALKNSPAVSQKARTRVLDVASRLGYVPNATARRLATNRTDCLYVAFAAGADDPFYWHVMRGIMEVSERAGYRIAFGGTRKRTELNSHTPPEVNPADVDGILVLNWHDRYIVHHLQDTKLPVVLVDVSGDHPDVPAVDNDDRASAQLGVEHLIRLGHRRIAFVGYALVTPFGRQTWQGYLAAMGAAKLSIEPDLLFTADPLERGVDAARHLLALPQPPTAVLAVTDEIAIGLMREAQRRGVRIPSELAVVGLDDIPLAAVTTPALTTVRIDTYQIGSTATEMLLGLIDHTYDGPTKIVVPPSLMVRESCGSLPEGVSAGIVG
jgi:LacI family transcriptional regulator